MILLETTWGKVRPPVIGSLLCCALDFAFGWGGYQLALWVGVPVGLFWAETW